MMKSPAAVSFVWKNVVIGADLDAVEFAHDNSYFLIKNRPPHHHSYEPSEVRWAEKSYELYNKGLCAFTDKATAIRVDPKEKIIKVLTRSSRYLVKYENLYLFDAENVFGVTLKRRLLHYRVIDWFDCRGLYDLKLDEIITGDDFVNKIKFFKTLRIDGDQKYLDLFCESVLTKQQLNNFEYSDTMARLKTISLLKSRGIDADLVLWKRDVYPIYETI